MRFRFETGGDTSRTGPGDLAGAVYGWSVANDAHPNAYLGFVGLYDNDGGPVLVPVVPFSRVAPDALVDGLLATSQTAELHFIGNKGNDTLRGSYANDEFDGREGADSMIGGDGDDTYRVNNKNDKIVEAAGEGDDRVYTTVSHTLSKNVESLVGTGTHKLALTGNDRPNDISGTAGSDTIKGLGGNDVIAASDGNDVLYGGKGKDVFMFVTPPSAANVDTIKDFKHSADTIMVSQDAHYGVATPDYYYAHPIPGSPLVAPLTPLNPFAFHASKSGKAQDFDDRITYDTTDGRLFFDPDGNGAAHRQLIAILTGHPNVAADDFLII